MNPRFWAKTRREGDCIIWNEGSRIPASKAGDGPMNRSAIPGVETMSSERNLGIAVAAYALVAVFSFGHAASDQANYLKENCITPADRTKAPGTSCYQDPGMSGMGAAMFWPLYWSWEVQQ